MSRDFRVFLKDILDAVQRIREYTSGISSSQFSADSKTFDAVIRNLEIIGEATKNVRRLSETRIHESNGRRWPDLETF